MKWQRGRAARLSSALVVLCWLGPAALFTPEARAEEGQDLLQRARAEFEAYRFEAALDLATECLTRSAAAEPAVLLEAYGVKVRCEMELGRRAEAELTFCQMLRVDPKWNPDPSVYTPDETGVFQAARTKCAGLSAPAPRRLAFRVQPTSVQEGKPIAPPVEVAVQDEQGLGAPTGKLAVTLSLAGGPEEAMLGGTCTQNTADGIARFDDLVIGKTGAGFALRASAAGLAPVISVPFSVLPPPSIPFESPPAATGKKAWYKRPAILGPIAGGVAATLYLVLRDSEPATKESELPGFPPHP